METLNRAQRRKILSKINAVIKYAETSKHEIVKARDAGDIQAKALLQFASNYEKTKTIDEKILIFQKFQLERTGKIILDIPKAIMGE